METRGHKGSIFDMRQLAGMLLFCALLLRGMIPGGYMPNFDAADGQGFLVICSSIGERVLPVDGRDAAPADTHQDGLCAFAMAGTFVPMLLFVLLLAVLPPRRPHHGLPQPSPGGPQWRCRPPAARGPPLLAA